MSLLSRLTRIEKRIPGGRHRITKIVETIVEPNPVPGGEPVPVAVVREDLDAGTVELWLAPHIPDPLPTDVDPAAVERASSSPPYEGAFSGLG
jgi:hypothetical protein